MFDFPAMAASYVTVVKELAKANASDWLWPIRVALGRSNSFNFNRVPAFKEVNACQWSDPRPSVLMKCTRFWLGLGYRVATRPLKIRSI